MVGQLGGLHPFGHRDQPEPLASSDTVRTMTRSLGGLTERRTNCWSTFSSSSGQIGQRRQRRVAAPEVVDRDPDALVVQGPSPSIAWDRSAAAVSVISRVRQAGARPRDSSSLTIHSARSGAAECDRRQVDRRRDLEHAAPTPVRLGVERLGRIHSVSRLMRPIRSASGMNTPGGTSPRVGLCQRSSASAPTTMPLARRSGVGRRRPAHPVPPPCPGRPASRGPRQSSVRPSASQVTAFAPSARAWLGAQRRPAQELARVLAVPWCDRDPGVGAKRDLHAVDRVPAGHDRPLDGRRPCVRRSPSPTAEPRSTPLRRLAHKLLERLRDDQLVGLGSARWWRGRGAPGRCPRWPDGGARCRPGSRAPRGRCRSPRMRTETTTQRHVRIAIGQPLGHPQSVREPGLGVDRAEPSDRLVEEHHRQAAPSTGTRDPVIAANVARPSPIAPMPHHPQTHRDGRPDRAARSGAGRKCARKTPTGT